MPPLDESKRVRLGRKRKARAGQSRPVPGLAESRRRAFVLRTHTKRQTYQEVCLNQIECLGLSYKSRSGARTRQRTPRYPFAAELATARLLQSHTAPDVSSRCRRGHDRTCAQDAVPDAGVTPCGVPLRLPIRGKKACTHFSIPICRVSTELDFMILLSQAPFHTSRAVCATSRSFAS
jgi:hypothetical protein